MMKPHLFFLCFLFSVGLSAQDYTIAVKPDSSGQIYLQTDSCSLQPTECVGRKADCGGIKPLILAD